VKLTYEQLKERDAERSEHRVLTTVQQHGDWYECGAGSMCWGLDKKYGAVPEVGDVCTVYGTWGRPISGIDLNGTPVFYKTEAQREEDHHVWVEELNAQRKAKFAQDKDALDAAYDDLPKPFQRRLDRFREDPDFRWREEAYESFILVEASKIAEHFKTAAAISEWSKIEDYKTQMEQAPFVSNQHSGNTFGVAVALAERLFRGGPI